ncbi:hypothetical protein KSF_105250 [Reticulibacter mediterranei]|uniref:Uncharacterized protein n=1 Tax=Reticulibacter mediterranei TaxID=2778369 RepID=A0A8J3N6L6_9CHLR|nr:hypothetical protein [Reticulibacter mediterranei]GHP00478.1 hypothetical protein KSF_105250 [Reticulibacter mediterranei]
MSLHFPSSPSSSPEAIWAIAFNELGQRIRHAFVRPESYQRALAYVRGLMGMVERKKWLASS